MVASLSGVGLALLGLLAPMIIPSDIPGWILHGLIGFSLALAILPWIFGRSAADDDSHTVQRAIYDRRRQNIDACRALITGWLNHSPADQRAAMESLPEFQALRGHFSDVFVAQLRRTDVLIMPDKRPFLMARLADELDRLERKWRLG